MGGRAIPRISNGRRIRRGGGPAIERGRVESGGHPGESDLDGPARGERRLGMRHIWGGC